ncbi:MAG: universal stress protein [Gammaproteobacteria bacterium]|nr:universal stress protein [Gammaproteobacteria bacterium]
MKILLATDGSESAKSAIDYLLQFPLPEGSELHLITVIEKEIYKSKKKTELNAEQRELLEQTKQMLHDEAGDIIAEAEAQLSAAGWRCNSQIREGHPSREIVRAAKKLGVDLVIVGSHGLGGIKRFLLGSVSDKVLAYACCSVLIIRPFISKPQDNTETEQAVDLTPKRILIAYDDSEPAKQAVTFCSALPLEADVEITNLTVLPLMKLYRQDVKQRLSWVWKEKKKLAKKSLERLSNEVQWSTPKVSTQLRESSNVSDEILTLADEMHCDLIVLGHKGKGAIEKFLLGSVTTRIAHHAPCSVLAVRTCS